MQPDGFGAAQRRLDDYLARVAEIQRQAEETQERIRTMRAQASSSDGTVTVVLAPGGRVERLSLTPRAIELGHERLASVITETIRSAHNDAAARTQDALRPLIGESDAMEFLREHVETAVEDDPAAAGIDDATAQRRPQHRDDGDDGEPFTDSFPWKGDR